MSTEEDIEELTQIFGKLISENEYIKKCYSKKKEKQRDPASLSYLIDRDLHQGECIKMGIGMESLLKDFIIKYSDLEDIKPKNQKGKKEKDHLFCDNKNKKIFYCEIKSNLKLDTEKSKYTQTKCLEIANELKEDYKDYEIKWCLLCLRYLRYDDIPKNIKKSYSFISENLLGINEYFEMLNINYKLTLNEQKKLLNQVADSMFNND